VDVHGTSSGLDDARDGALTFVVSDVGTDHPAAFAGKDLCSRAPDARSGPSNQSNFTFESQCSSSPSRRLALFRVT
jgi:hypothetical protein